MNLSYGNENVARIQHEIKLIRNQLTEKIWELAHQEDTDGFFQWSTNGKWITIERELFEENYLRNPYHQHQKSPIATENWPSFVRQLNLYGFRKVQPIYARGFTGSKPECRLNGRSFLNGKSRWVNYYNPLFHRDKCGVADQVTRGPHKATKAGQKIQKTLSEPTDIEFVKRGPVTTDPGMGRRTFHDWNQRRGSTESHVSEISNADECPPLPPLPSMVTPDGLNHHGFMGHQNSMLPNPSCFPYFSVGQNIDSFMKDLPKFNDQDGPCITKTEPDVGQNINSFMKGLIKFNDQDGPCISKMEKDGACITSGSTGLQI